MWFCSLADKEILSKVLFTVLYRDPATKFLYVKRCPIGWFILNRDYFFSPDGMEGLHVDTRDDFSLKVPYVKKPRVKILEQVFKASSYAEKGLKALGVRLEAREVESVEAESFQDVQF